MLVDGMQVGALGRQVGLHSRNKIMLLEVVKII